MLGSRRSFLLAGLGARLLAQAGRGAAFPGAVRRYPDPMTEFDVYLLTDPAHTSLLPAHYNRAITKNSAHPALHVRPRRIAAGVPHGPEERADAPTDRGDDLDAGSLTLTPDNRSFCYFAGRSLYIANLATLRERKLYEIPEGWERCPGMSVGPDGTHATFAERKGETLAAAHGDAGAGGGAHGGGSAVRDQRPDSAADARADPVPPRRRARCGW